VAFLFAVKSSHDDAEKADHGWSMDRHKRPEEEVTTMGRIDAQLVAQRLREVVADEPKAFAYEIGVSLSALYNYLNGRIPSTEVLFRIARYTGRPMEWFLSPVGVDSMDLMVQTARNGDGAGMAAVTH
jgi:transcriptional regulator with XRE-family HTH domain